MKPFLKWAGGKYKIIDTILQALPQGDLLIEPFVGSGAVFLNADYDGYWVADANVDLIDLYQVIQSEGSGFVDYAASLFSPKYNNEKSYYILRDEFNGGTDVYRKSALFVYLNRHGFNGLCRYNSKGGFNVPFGRYVNPVFPEKEILNFYGKSKRAVFEVADFKSIMDKAPLDSVIYCDPPYVPLTATSDFSSYTANGFDAKDQEDLANSAKALASKGIPVVISNHDTAFTRSIYRDATITAFEVQRFISCNGKKRGKAPELIASYF